MIEWLGPLAAIIWADLLLSGDNALVIALVCQELPKSKRRLGMILGTGAAVGLRIIGGLFAAALLMVPALSLIGGIFLLWVAVKLIAPGSDEVTSKRGKSTLLGAVIAIAVADAGMSLDNVMAIAAIAGGELVLIAVGIAISIPMVIAGAALISLVIEKLPILKWGGAGLLAWVAGAIGAKDNVVEMAVGAVDHRIIVYAVPALAAILVLSVGGAWQIMERQKTTPRSAPRTSPPAPEQTP